MNRRWKLKESDSTHCSQVLVYDKDDLEYWKNQAKQTGHLMVLIYHVPKDRMGYPDSPHEVYHMFPPEQRQNVYTTQLIERSGLVDLEGD